MNKATVVLTGDAHQLTSTLDKVKKSAGGVKDKFGPAATAASGMAGALGGMSGAGGAALGAIDNMANALMAGGPLALGLAVATTALVGLAGHFMTLNEKAKQAEDAMKASAKAAAAAFASSVDSMLEAQMGMTKLNLELAQDAKRIAGEHADYLTRKIKANDEALTALKKHAGDAILHDEMQANAAEIKNLTALNAKLIDQRQGYNDTYNDAVTKTERLTESMRKEQKAQDKVSASVSKDTKKTKENTQAHKKRTKALKEEKATVADLMNAVTEGFKGTNFKGIGEELKVAMGDVPPVVLHPVVSIYDKHTIQEIDDLHEHIREQDRKDAAIRKQLADREIQYRKGLFIGYSQEALSMEANAIATEARLQTELYVARKAGDSDRVTSLEQQEREAQAQILVSVMQRLSQEAIGRGTILAIEGMATGNVGYIAGGATLIGLGLGGMAGAGAVTGYMAGDTANRNYEASQRDKATMTDNGSGPASIAPHGITNNSSQHTTVNYIINGNAFGLGQDDSARGVASLAQRGADLNGWRP